MSSKLTTGFPISCLILVVLVSACSPSGPSDRVIVDTGQLTGVLHGDVAAFKGIPYAAPPIEELRWRPTRAPLTLSRVEPIRKRCVGESPGDASRVRSSGAALRLKQLPHATSNHG